MPMGPLKLLDEIGWDTSYKVSKILEHSFGDIMKVPNMLRRRAEKSLHPHARVKKYRSRRKGTAKAYQDTVRRLLHPMKREAERSLEEGVVKNRDIIDLALVLGIGFPGTKRIWKE